VFEGGKRIAYGARAITEGGYQSVPRLTFPGGALIGCAAGFVNVPRIKGVHNAMGTGMQAAEHVAAALAAGRANDELAEYENGWRDSPVGKDLFRSATSSRCGRSSAPCSASRSAASTCGRTRCSASRCSARSVTASPIATR
jgi:flavin-dependent dehydrogenase